MFYIASIFKICNWSNTTVFHLWERKLVFSDIFGETTPYKLILFGSLPNARVYANAKAKKLHSTPFCCCVDWHFRLKTIQIWGNLLNDIIHYTRAYLNYCGDCVYYLCSFFIFDSSGRNPVQSTSVKLRNYIKMLVTKHFLQTSIHKTSKFRELFFLKNKFWTKSTDLCGDLSLVSINHDVDCWDLFLVCPVSLLTMLFCCIIFLKWWFWLCAMRVNIISRIIKRW